MALAAAFAWGLPFTTQASATTAGGVLAVCGFAALRRGRRETATLAFVTAAAFALLKAPLLRGSWPAPLLLGLFAVLGVLRFRVPWLKRGAIGLAVAGWSALVVAVSASALIAWWFIVHPDLRDLPALPVGLHPALLIAGVVVWAAANAAAEESYFRGALQHELERELGRGAVIVQAMAFGSMHYHGFPRGFSGVALATAFGLMAGALRRRAGGLLAPWVAHAATDLAILSLRLTVIG